MDSVEFLLFNTFDGIIGTTGDFQELQGQETKARYPTDPVSSRPFSSLPRAVGTLTLDSEIHSL